MSKAFTKEQDEEQEVPDFIPSIPGGKNLITPHGFAAMQSELRQLSLVERPKVVETVAWAAGNGDRSENADYTYGKRRLREIDKRVRFLTKRLDVAQIIDPLERLATGKQLDTVFFGATVTILDEQDRQRTYAIVGVDEADASKGKISWASPLGSALLQKKLGDYVQFRAPQGLQEVEILEIIYKEIV